MGCCNIHCFDVFVHIPLLNESRCIVQKLLCIGIVTVSATMALS